VKAFAYVNAATQGFAEEWDLDQLWSALRQIYPVGLDLEAVEAEVGGRDALDREHLIEVIKQDAHAAYEAREAQVQARSTQD
jgi:preprotein translocase subunit SecA